jgi:hypothetical protein
MVNLTRAKDAAMSLAMEVLNGNGVASRVAAPPIRYFSEAAE